MPSIVKRPGSKFVYALSYGLGWTWPTYKWLVHRGHRRSAAAMMSILRLIGRVQ